MVDKYNLIFVFSVFLASFAQILLKMSANRKYSNKVGEYFNLYVIISYSILFISTILTIIAFKKVSLHNGSIIEAVGYIFILILGRLFLKEQITRNKLLGNILIGIGIIIFNL